jgi:mannose-6-phosphate isomerase-like protein (cupin superfamily)
VKIDGSYLINTEAFFEMRPWGQFLCFGQNIECTAKVLILHPGEALSAQLHNYRDQLYFIPSHQKIVVEWSTHPVQVDMNDPEDIFDWWQNIDGKWQDMYDTSTDGGMYMFNRRVIHRVKNITKSDQYIFEVAYGENDEEDIIRVEDKYGRL